MLLTTVPLSEKPEESPTLKVAIRTADRIRREHNGVGGVYLYLGHDGDNSCEFRDIDGKQIAKASGSSLYDAVGKCQNQWLKQKWIKNLDSLMQGAVERFGAYDCKLFTTANLQREITERYGVSVTGDEIVEVMADRVDVVRLMGGCHWLILPGGIFRHQ